MAGNPPSTTNLLDREGRIVADILERYRNVMLVATERISNRSNAGEAAYNSMHMDMETRGLIKSTQDLLALTRQLRELWVVGPLRKPGEGEREAEDAMDREARCVVELLNGLRERVRPAALGPRGTYVSGALPALPKTGPGAAGGTGGGA